ncbi:MAG: quinate 5-dehydrogenase [Armatimonadetes bacterium]|nr:quinate 5-dehydrogenase [Armatimonadota bacterium]
MAITARVEEILRNDDASVKHVVSVSLGTSKRDKSFRTDILGQTFEIDRIGTDGDRAQFKEIMEALDGHVAALGVGGADIWLATEKKRYAFREILGLIKGVQKTPVVDGSGLKHTLERRTIEILEADKTVDFSSERVLLVAAVDRFGMAQALDKVCPNVLYGDFYFGLGIPLKITKYSKVSTLAGILLPVITQLPFQWFYPTGAKQEERKPKYPEVFKWATLIAGDWHFIRRYAPDDMTGKTILTQTLRSADLEWLRTTGVKRAITTTPVMGGETFATNVMEGVLLTLIGKPQSEATDADYLAKLEELGWKPNVIDLTTEPVPATV